MLSVDDLITLPYTPDLTTAGIAYASRSLAHTYDRMGGSRIDRLRRIVAGVAVELAFRRYLVAEGVPHDVYGATPFTSPDRYDLALGGRRCDIKSYLISRKKLIREVRRRPQSLLDAPALVPSDQMLSDRMKGEDIYIFAFLNGLITPRRRDLDRAMAAGQPYFILHPFSSQWSRPQKWSSLSPLILKADTTQDIALELGGQGAERQFQTEQVLVPPLRRVRAGQNFFSLAYLNSAQLPDGQVGIHSSPMGQTYLIAPHEWGNIWVYGMEVFMVGYLRHSEYRQLSRRLPRGSTVLQYQRTKTENMALPMHAVRPLPDLLNRAKAWH